MTFPFLRLRSLITFVSGFAGCVFTIWGQNTSDSDVLPEDEWFESLLGDLDSTDPWEDPSPWEAELTDMAPETVDVAPLETDLLSLSLDANLEVSFGWKENVLLSADGSVDAASVRTAIDLFAHKPSAIKDWDLMALFWGEAKRYEDVENLEDEYLAMARVMAVSKIGDRSDLEVFGAGLASRQAFDRSDFEIDYEVQQVSLVSPEVGLVFSNKSSSGLSTSQLDFSLGEFRYGESLEDYEYAKLGGQWKRRLGEAHKLTARIELGGEDYSEKLSRGSGIDYGDTMGLEVVTARTSLELYSWGGDSPLAMKSKVYWQVEDDVDGDYYERQKLDFRQSFELHRANWKLDFAWGYNEVTYPNRMVVDIDSSRSDWSVYFRPRFELGLGENWVLFAEAEKVKKRSNDLIFDYDTQSMYVGFSAKGFWQ
ncbi:hypothetical protein [Pelagicoccus albus]|uniref:Beta-barrel porin 2 n=1 Tax=Pelagicoccus albus TaxID=415222 RepID=A0A7X1E8H1_9BACT|nr:hypothetical protein [Pelagicoccus albus]MBC2606349.1 hypothetical protein [Pelagicoccus albus]